MSIYGRPASLSERLPRGPRPPIPWVTVFTVLWFVALATMVAVTFQDYGISWDEEVQNTYGRKLLAFYASGFRDWSAMTYLNLFYYGGFFDLIAAIVNRVSPFGVYETRHLLGGIFMIVGLFGCWRLTNLLAGRRAALIAVVSLTLTPILYGHGFINPKDAPLAWLIIWVIYYACRALGEGRPTRNTVIGFGVALGLAFGTRILAAPVLCYISAALVLTAIMDRWRPRPGTVPVARTAVGLAAALPLAYVIMAVFWPWGVINPLNPIKALHEFANFPWKGWLLWNGEMVPATNLPRDYLPRLLLYQLSEHSLIGITLAVIAGIAVFIRGGLALLTDRRALQYVILIQAAVVPVLAFVILRPTIYNGMRHFLFVVPPSVILGAIGWDRLFTLVADRWRGAISAVIGSLLIGLLFWQFLRMVDLHPYEYVAYNRIVGGLAGASGRFELDYWDTSLAEASRRLSARLAKVHSPEPPEIFICGNRLAAAAFLPKNIKTTYVIEDADYFISVVPSACRAQVDVTRNRIIEVRRNNVTLSYVIDLGANRGKREPLAQSATKR
jgi:4-amino-4-deoxy-L-arabinose transferase-like glycosyltransferase